MKDKLINLGFSEKETTIYLALLKLGRSSAPSLAKSVSQDRRVIYDILDLMAKKGMVSITKIKNVTNYEATPPEEILEQNKNSIKEFQKIVPQLNKISPKKDHSYLRIWYGVKAANRIINNALKSNSEFLLMGRGGYLLDQLGDAKYQYIPKLKKKKWRMIQTQEYKKYPKEFKIKNMKYLPKDIKLETGFAMIGDIVYLFTKKHEIEVIEIMNKAFADTYKKYFEIFWEKAR